MSKKLEEIINDAMELGLEERAQLAGSLLLSLDEPSESEVERLWLQEAERRLQEYREGKVKGIPAEEVVMPQEGSTLDRKDVRVITGFTFSKIGYDPENWIRRAKDFKEAAELMKWTPLSRQKKVKFKVVTHRLVMQLLVAAL